MFGVFGNHRYFTVGHLTFSPRRYDCFTITVGHGFMIILRPDTAL